MNLDSMSNLEEFSLTETSAKEKNAKAIQKQEQAEVSNQKKAEFYENLENMSIEDVKAKLSKKNEDYLYRLNKGLISVGKTEEEAATIIDGLIKEIYLNQIKGLTAQRLYGSPSEKVQAIINVKKAPKHHPFWMYGVDTSLIFLALFGLMYGVLGFTKDGSKSNNQTGILTLFVVSIMWGFVLAWFNIQMKKDKKDRPGILATILYMGAGMVALFGIMAISNLLPATINPVLPSYIYIIIAALAFGGRFVFRRANQITGSSLF